MRGTILILAFAVGLLLRPGEACAQGATLTGFVRSDAQAPIPGAYVTIPALNLSTVTNDNGQYLFVVSADRVTGQQVTIHAMSLGYADAQVVVTLRAGTINQNLTLTTRAIALDELLVTGTAGRREARAQAATIANINTARVMEVAPVTTVSGLLQARTPGVMVRNYSGTSGTHSEIRIRGVSSMALSNSPLFFLDGIRISGGSQQIYGLGGQAGSRLNDIKPEDIESIEIIKGPAAATLYGSDAVAGVVNIITKKGRAGSGFTQTITMEYGRTDPNFTPPDNWGRCTAAAINNPSVFPACSGRAVGDILQDNPLLREKAFLDGVYRNIAYSLSGGGDRYGVRFSLGADDDQGTLPSNEYGHLTTRASFDFFAREGLRLEFGFGLSRTATRLPNNDNNIYGYLGGGLLGDPRTVGSAKDGWYAPNRQVMAISAIDNRDVTMRIQPRAALYYEPFDWFRNRLTVGADIGRTEALSFWAKNADGWWDNAPMNTGQVSEYRRTTDRITMEYLGTVTRNLTEAFRFDLSVGSQAITYTRDNVFATGRGLVNNDVRSVSAAAELTGGGQSFSQTRNMGVFSQGELSWRERLYFQAGIRRDQSSTFGIESKPFYSPKVGLSYVISDESYFQTLTDFLPEGSITELRLRSAFGVSGRQPSTGARSTYSPSTNQISETQVVVGVRPGATGNPLLRAERSQELEMGFDAGFVQDRLGLNFTYFRKEGIDQILALPVPPSLGVSGPLVNVGSLLTRGFELSADARLLTLPNLAWEVRASANTHQSEVLDLGDVPETATRKVGFPLFGAWGRRILDVDVENNRVTVSDTLEYLGNGSNYPGWESALSTTLTLWQKLTFYAQADARGDYYLSDGTTEFRDRQMGTGEVSVKGCAAYGTDAEGNCTPQAVVDYMRRYGPWFTESGTALSRRTVTGDYAEPNVRMLRLREASVSYRVPTTFVQDYLKARSATLVLTMRNLHTWTNYLGLDPESGQFLTVPADRRWTFRFQFTF